MSADGAPATETQLAGQTIRPAVLIFMIYLGFGVVEVLDSTLSRMHLPGGASAGASKIASPFSVLSRPAAAEVIDQWNQWSARYSVHTFGQATGTGLPLVEVLLIYVAFDVFFIALPVFLLIRTVIKHAAGKLKGFETQKKAEAQEADADIASRARLELTRISGLHQLLATAAIAIAISFAADLAEDGLLACAAWKKYNFLIGATGVASVIKWMMLASAVIGVVVGLIGSREMRQYSRDVQQTDGRNTPNKWAYLLALRIQLAVGVLLLLLGALRGDLGHQLDDAFLFPFGGGGRVGYLTAGVALILLVVTLATAKLCVRAYVPRTPNVSTDTSGRMVYEAVPHKRFLRSKIIACAVAGVVLVAVAGAAMGFNWPFGVALMAPGVLLILVAVYSYFASGETKPDVFNTDRPSNQTIGWRYSTVLAVIPLVVLISLAARNGVRLLTIHEYAYGWKLIILFPALSILFGWGVIAATSRGLGRLERFEATRPDGRPTLFSIFVAAGLSAALFVLVGSTLQSSGNLLGPWGTVFTLCIALLLGGSALVLLSDHVRAWGVLATVGLRRTPFITAIMLCFVANSAIGETWIYHDVRLGQELAADHHQQIPLSSALDKWSDKQREKNKGRTEIPLVFVASAGGGIRAAYWTALVMRCLVTGDGTNECPKPVLPLDSILLASGISGGSLGLAGIHGVPDFNRWLEVLQHDFLGPSVAALAFRDLPNALLHINIHDSDRAVALERAWEDEAAKKGGRLDRGLMEAAYTADNNIAFPLLVLNGTSVTDGCRVTASALDLSTVPPTTKGQQSSSAGCLALNRQRFADGETLPALPATKDAFDNTCSHVADNTPHDLRLSTAALLSARFPYVSPTGGLNSCAGSDRTYDLDGGLIDSSAALPLAMLWPEIVTWLNKHDDTVCFAPKLIIMENGYLQETKSEPPARPAELGAPITGSMAAQAAAAPTSRQAAAFTFQKSFAGKTCGADKPGPGWRTPNVVDFYPVAQPGIEAPLGWTLSVYSQNSLKSQVISLDNQCSAQIVASWFSGSTTQPDVCKRKDAPPK